MKTAILLFSCPDQKGIIANLSQMIVRYSGNIIDLDQNSTEDDGGHFFSRVSFSFDPDLVSLSTFDNELESIAKDYTAVYSLHEEDKRLVMPILCSKEAHCLNELLHQWYEGYLPVDIPFVISNSNNHQALVAHYGLDYHYIPASTEDRKEADILRLINGTDTLILARYMQILSKEFLESYSNDIINIHHSFLPSFKGANPYKQAYDRGVKIIGATTHYVTEGLDEGPIIQQEVAHVSHKDNVLSLKQKGRALEQRALVETIRLQAEHRIICDGNKTIVFH